MESHLGSWWMEADEEPRGATSIWHWLSSPSVCWSRKWEESPFFSPLSFSLSLVAHACRVPSKLRGSAKQLRKCYSIRWTFFNPIECVQRNNSRQQKSTTASQVCSLLSTPPTDVAYVHQRSSVLKNYEWERGKNSGNHSVKCKIVRWIIKTRTSVSDRGCLASKTRLY